VDNEALRAMVMEQPHASTRELSAALGPSKDSINRHLHQLDFVSKRPREDPHELTDAQAQRRVDICKNLLENPLDERFWKRIVTCDEKWIFLRNPDKRKQWVAGSQEAQPMVRQDRFGHKVMLCVWWNFEGVLHFELVPDGRAVNAELYSEQLSRVYEVLKRRYPALVNRKRVLLQQDNAPAHRARLTQAKIQELGAVEVLPHPAYSPDIAPSDYGLFRSMATFLRGRRFETFDEVEAACREFFVSKSKDWYRQQIGLLAERWVTVIENDGLYFAE
jgi:histone-lysine N-methyltransferase SETMAR